MPILIIKPKLKSILVQTKDLETSLTEMFKDEKPNSMFLSLDNNQFDIYFLDSSSPQDGVFTVSNTLPVNYCGIALINIEPTTFSNQNQVNEFCKLVTKNILFF